MPRTTAPNDEIRSLVESFTSQLEHLVKRMALEDVLAALNTAPASSPERRGPGRPKGSKTMSPRPASAARKGGKRTPEALEALGAEFLAHVQAHPGQRGEQIAAALESDVETMRLPMQKLVAAGQVRTEGQRRGTTYFPGAGKAAGAKRGPKAGKKPRKQRRRAGRAKSARKARRQPAAAQARKARGVLTPKPRAAAAAKPQTTAPMAGGTPVVTPAAPKMVASTRPKA
jgi:hypothetical protein